MATRHDAPRQPGTGPGPTPRPETAAKADTRRFVLDVAARLFAERGYNGTNLRLVADELQVTRQALYYHFQSKSDILSGLFDKMLGALEDALDAAPIVAGEPRFVSLLRAHVTVIASHPDLVSVLLHERPEMAKIVTLDASRRRVEYNQRLIDAYDEGKREHAVPDVDSWIAVNTLLAAANGIASWFHPSTSEHSAEEVAAGVLGVLLTGVVQVPRSVGARTGL